MTFKRLQPVKGFHPDDLPQKCDFGARKGCLDQICAWEHFGGLMLDEAYRRFCERPDIYQEDFMFMGWRPFGYYFPVIETYLHEVQAKEEFDDTEAWILAQVISIQWNQAKLRRIDELRQRVLALCAYVKSHLGQYSLQPERQREVHDAWTQLEELVRG